MNAKMWLVGLAVLVVGAVGCGEAFPGGDELGMGEVDVQVSALIGGTNGDPALAGIDRVVVILVGRTGQGEKTIEIIGSGPTWTGSSGRILTGEYDATAEAFSGESRVWASETSQVVTVVENGTPSVTFFINEKINMNHDLPHFVSLSLSKKNVFIGESIDIDITVAGGTAPYSLTGRFAGGIGADGDNTKGSFGTGTFTGNAGTITWTAGNVSGAKWFVLVVTDARGDVAELGVNATVDASGIVGVGVSYNQAPEVNATVRTINDFQGTAAYITVSATDPDARSTGSVMTWATGSTCPGIELHDSSGVNGALIPDSGVFPQGGAGDTVSLQLMTVFVPRRAGLKSCNLAFIATDPEGASATHNVTLNTEWVQPN